ncbi:DNA-3-methyladenine glycosylase [Achromobacter pulmonis]|uniref:DNA-3-methyladenine glycosylase n=1 Tax=Achromobacter pulmonis TaxID=1389932 RepID=A0A2N8KQP7_9BURK|nr:DNA-3-methyladenine glycosylase [Achromobacter pulmonis]PND35781.1 DNA-3-methyladenine glycosylase [Achromobacter pulmonis]
MEKEDLLAQILTRSVQLGDFGDWADVLGDYAGCLWDVRHKLEAEEFTRFIDVGAAVYRTLARAEAYRRSSVWKTDVSDRR